MRRIDRFMPEDKGTYRERALEDFQPCCFIVLCSQEIMIALNEDKTTVIGADALAKLLPLLVVITVKQISKEVNGLGVILIEEGTELIEVSCLGLARDGDAMPAKVPCFA